MVDYTDLADPKTLKEWMTADLPLAVLDIRSQDEFEAAHIRGAVWMLAEEVPSRSYELAAPEVPLVICGPVSSHLLDYLRRKGHKHLSVISGSEGIPEPLEKGPSKARLWKPAPFLEEVLPAIPRGKVLDLACGTGRNSVYLALQGFEVDAVDFLPDALENVRALAKRNCVQVNTKLRNLRKPPYTWIGSYDLIIGFFFLERSLFPHIREAVRQGGAVVYETFLVEQSSSGKPRNQTHLLGPNELLRAFSGFRIGRYEEKIYDRENCTARLFATKMTLNS